ncbi:Ig-like domain-containing alpha-2-macroglobulin family protein [Aquimarina agarivorans]|uniref:Ig-like domain-containing alpha-2-macroglobulin family protein n=1 Tax=Aquimarina agarivorans TaxID=980584 RepID=UPI0002E2E58B|nr:Ig-like domain-containing alpha-2-macroglobulin family protein [Aquimarina agarivorans]
MKRYSLILFLVILFSSLFQSCKKKVVIEEKVDGFDEFVSAYPNKLVSTSEPITFYLNKIIEKEGIYANAISISPNIKGSVTLKDNTIAFVPNQKLENNTEYTVTLHLDQLYNNVNEKLKKMVVQVKTVPLDLSISLNSPYLLSKEWYSIDGEIKASDYIEYGSLAKIVSTSYDNYSPQIRFTKSANLSKKFSFKIDSIKRFEADNILKIKWDGKAINSKSKGSRAFVITGKSNFKLLDIKVFNDGKQSIELSFSDPIDTSQNLKGLVQFLNTTQSDYTYKIKSNLVTVYPKSYQTEKLDIEIFKGIKNTSGYNLKDSIVRTVYFKQLEPSLNFIKSGTLLPNSENLKINFQAVNLKAVDVLIYEIYKNNVLQFLQSNNLNNQGSLRYVGRPVSKHTINLADKGLNLQKLNSFSVDLADLIAVKNGVMYRLELDFNQDYATYTCNGETSNKPILYGEKDIDITPFNRSDYYGGYDTEFRWRDREDPCKYSYYHNKSISTNIIATNLGVIVKKGSNENTFVSVTDILTTNPVKDATVALLNLQQQEIVTATTNSEGIVLFEAIEGALFAVVSKGNSTTYVKLNDGSALSMSKFDVSGAKIQEGIKGYIYGERGVWRPGDHIYATFVLNDNSNPLPLNHPIAFELIDPKGNITAQKIVNKNSINLYAFAPKTNQDALTGNWLLKVKVGTAIFRKTIKVETIKPNRLKIKTKTAANLIKAGTPISGDVSVKWLHGAIAKGLNYDIETKFTQTTTTFSNFKNYHFDDVTRSYNTQNESLSKGSLNEAGQVYFSKKPILSKNAPGMLKASFITKVYENGGDFSTDVFSTKLSPYTSYAGIQVAEEKQSRNYLFTDKEYKFDVAAVSEDGKGIQSNLDIKVYKLNWSWWWRSSSNGLSHYDGTKENVHYTAKKVTTNNNGKGSFILKVSKNDWGRYLIKVRDKRSNHVTSKIIYFDWPSWYGNKKNNQDKTNATMLVFSSDKATYETNENAIIKFPSSSGGRALVTIENGTTVLDHFWVETKDKQTEFTFPILKNYTPNIFINVSLLQPHAQTKNDLPIRMYGAIPIEVYNKKTKLTPQIQLPNEFRPETNVTLKVSEKEGKQMYYTIAMVDEGLLDLTRFKTPNPWFTFYKKQSLGVKTWDIFDDVIGAYGGEVHQILSIGGDEAEAGSKNKKANRFKPVVRYLGPFKLESNETKTHQIAIPNYVGSVKTMVVAADPVTEAYGSVDKTSFVRKPVMVLASLPRKITPKEKVVLPVTVFAMKPHIKQVKVRVTTDDKNMNLEGNAEQLIQFDTPGEKMAYFTLNVNEVKGIGKVKVTATSGKESASYEVEIDVYNPNPITTETTDYVLQPNEQKQITFKSFGAPGTNQAQIEFSTVPPMNFTKRLGYLVRYPHGCVEQTTSSGFPQLYLADLFDLSQEQQHDVERNIKATIALLKQFQLSNGGLTYWPGSSYKASVWGTSYAGHFMLEAEKKGFALPLGFKSNWLSFQKQKAKKWRKRTDETYYDNSLSQAYRLYTLSLANSPDLGAMNRLRETSGLSNVAKKRLAAAYALIGKTTIAAQIVRNLDNDESDKNWYNYSYGSATRNNAMSLETYVLLQDQLNGVKLAKKIAAKLNSNAWMSTQTTAYSLLAMAKFALKNGSKTGIITSYNTNNAKAVNINSSKSLFVADLVGLKDSNELTVKNNSSGVLFASIINKGILPVGKEKIVQNNLQAGVSYVTKDGTIISPNSIKQGTNFIAEIRIKNTRGATIDNVALTHFLPSGWEIINTRFTDFGSNTESSEVDFIDIKDANINYYFSLKKLESKTFKIQLNASYLGDYYLPGIQAEAMYDNDFMVRTKGEWIKVVQ